MKFMKLGTRPDTFYTKDGTRSVLSDEPKDIVIKINNSRYLLHKFQVLPKCGLLQRLCEGSEDSNKVTVELHDVPGGEGAFELCAKFCYGIAINLSAHNFVPAICAAKFLRMTESVERGNFVLKLEAFFSSCILEGWKDSVAALEATAGLPEWSENLGMIRRCIDSVVEKIITPTSKVTWSYTYTRPGYTRNHQQSPPKDWWTEDISDLPIDLFRTLIVSLRSTTSLSPPLVGEALHVYASRHLPDLTNTNTNINNPPETREMNKQMLQSIVTMIPIEAQSVSTRFLLRLLSIANYVGASPVAKNELIRRASLQLEEARVEDLLMPSHSSLDQHRFDIDLVGSVLHSYLVFWRRNNCGGSGGLLLRSIKKVGRLVDCYLQEVSRDVNMPVSKVVAMAEALPEVARERHDDLYKAINTYLKEHPDLRKSDKKRLCRMLDCQKLSPEVCAHAVKNERLPLRTVVQVLFFDQERVASTSASTTTPKLASLMKERLVIGGGSGGVGQGKAKVSPEEQHENKVMKMVPNGKVLNKERSVVRREIHEQVGGSQGIMARTRSVGTGRCTK